MASQATCRARAGLALQTSPSNGTKPSASPARRFCRQALSIHGGARPVANGLALKQAHRLTSGRGWRSTVRTALAEDQQPGGNPDSAAALKAIGDVKAALLRVASDSFSSLSGNLKAELKDAGFSLSSGPVLLELGQDMGSVLLEMGRGMEEANTSRALAAAGVLVASLERGAAPPGSSQRAALGRRLRTSGRFLTAMGSSAPEELAKLGSALLRLGEEFSKDSKEDKVDAAAVYGKRSFKVGPVDVEVTANQAALGSFIAGIFSISTWEAVSSFAAALDSSPGYPSERANLVASSLKQALLFSGYGTAALSLAACLGLGALAIQLSAPPVDEE